MGLGLWIFILVVSLNPSQNYWIVPTTEPTTALILGFVFILDFVRIMKEDKREERSQINWASIIIGIIWIWIFEWVLFLTDEEYSFAWIAAVTFGILWVDVSVFFHEILKKPFLLKLAEFVWIFLVAIGCVATFLVTLVKGHSIRETLHIILAAALLVEQFLIPMLEKEEEEEKEEKEEKEEEKDRTCLRSSIQKY